MEDFMMMANRAGMAHFAGLRTDTYAKITHEFIATFEDNLREVKGNNTVSYSIAGTRQTITFEEFCDCFGFSHDGDRRPNELLLATSSTTWGKISVHGNADYARKKISTIQNPTIRYFTYFLASTLFGRGDMGAMTSPDILVLHQALFGDQHGKPNLGALLCAHFRCQRAASAGEIRCGGLVTQIALSRGINLPPMTHVLGTTTLDNNYMVACRFMGVDRTSPHNHVL